MNKPAFNFLPITDENSCPKTGTQVQLMYIEDMHKINNCLLFTQMCDAGYRMVRINEDYSKWNQCIFEDIDYKFYIENHKDFIDPNVLYEQLYEWLYNNYRNVFLYCELSRHMNSFHIIFYFDVQRTKNNRMMCKAISDFIVKQAFKSLGYEKIIEFPKVFDDCSDSFYQPCFITLNNFHLNKECNGKNSEEIATSNYYSVKTIYDKLCNKTKKTHNKTTSNEENLWSTEYTFNANNKYTGEYINHHERYYLFKSIVGLCGMENETEIRNEWENCAEQLIEGNNHDKYFYINEPYRNNWIDWINKNEEFCYIDNELLKQFGYEIKFINKDTNGNKTNKKTKFVSKEKIYI